MSTDTTHDGRRRLRLWPAVAVALIIFVLRYVLPWFVADTTIFGVIAGAFGLVVILLWWLLFSRAPWRERLTALAVMAVAIAATRLLVDRSIANGMMGNMVYAYAVPTTLPLFFVGWAVLSQSMAPRVRSVTMVLAIFAGCLVWTLVRTEGVLGAGESQLAWRWSPTPEQRLLAQSGDIALPPQAPPAAEPSRAAEPSIAQPSGNQPAVAAPVPSAVPGAAEPSARAVSTAASPAVDPTPAVWPGFRGPARDGVVHGVRIDPDWNGTPPTPLWRRPVGPGWSSFAVRGTIIYTQEQRGGDEVIAAYDIRTGKPVWAHKDPIRFWESNGGAGPRATPTIDEGRLYAVGATGLLNVLDASSGRRLWSKDVTKELGAKVPYWGFSSSPLIVDDLVIVHVGALAAYDKQSGAQRWVSNVRKGSYSSPHLVTIDGVRQILQQNGAGAIGVSIGDGATLWEYAWEGAPMLQPAILSDGEFLVASGDMMGGMGLRRIGVTHTGSTWTANERWASRGLKPYFNDFVVHKGHAYGFDGTILSCIELNSGERKWKNGRYGQGQMLLLADQDLLIVTGEEGDLALVAASPDGFTELGRVKGIDGKTWNHPVLVGDVLLVRNGEEMAAYKLRLR